MRAHAVGEARGRGVPLDDLVEALAGEAGATVVDEQARLEAIADDPRAALGKVCADGARRGRADGDDPLLGALAARPQDADLEVDVAGLEADGLGGTQPAGVHQLQQRAVAERGRHGASRLLEQLRHLVAAQDLREPPALLGRAQVRGRIGLEDALAPQVAVERAQAGDLALQRRRRHRRLLTVARRQAGDEARQIGVRDRERVAMRQVGAVLEQVAAVCLERVARQPPLELEVGEKVEDQVLERLGGRGSGERSVGDGHRDRPSRFVAVPLYGATTGSGEAFPHASERDDGLRILVGREDRVELRERDDLDVDALVLVDLRALVDVGDAGGEEEVDLLVREAGRGEERAERLPVGGLLADLLRQLTLGRGQRVLALFVELARGDLEQVGDADRLARLADEPQLVVIEDDDADGARMGDELANGLLPILVAERGALDGEELPVEDVLGLGALELGAHTAAASSSRVRAMSSIAFRASVLTRSVGSWLFSVPLATFTQGMPAASKTLASEAPPVVMRRGS